MWTRKFASQVLREFADSRRRVFSDWRILIVARRLAAADNAPLPGEKKAIEIRQDLVKRGDIQAVPGLVGVYVSNLPYSNILDYSEEQLIQEANPFAVFGFQTAMTHHGLTDLIGKAIYPIAAKDFDPKARTPLGTMPDDWSEDVPLPPRKRPKKIGDSDILWTQPETDPGFGVTVGYSHGVPIYLTDVERTLLDAIRFPEKCGGIGKVLRAWKGFEDLNLDRIVDYTERYDNQVLRQRVGFLVEKLGHTHGHLAEWRHGLQRGGSLKLVSSGPYSSTYSERWNLSINVPAEVLSVLE